MSNKNKIEIENDEDIMRCQINDWDSSVDCQNEYDDRYVLTYIPVSQQSKCRSVESCHNYIQELTICETCYNMIKNGLYGSLTKSYLELAKSVEAVMVVDLDARKEVE